MWIRNIYCMKITFENFQWHSLQLKSYFNTMSLRFTQVWHDFTERDVSVKVKMACDAPTHGRKYVDSRTFASTLLVSVFSQEVEPAAEVWSRSDTSSRVQITWCWKVKSRLPISSKANRENDSLVELDCCTGTMFRVGSHFTLLISSYPKSEQTFRFLQVFLLLENHYKSCGRIFFRPSGQKESDDPRNVGKHSISH